MGGYTVSAGSFIRSPAVPNKLLCIVDVAELIQHSDAGVAVSRLLTYSTWSLSPLDIYPAHWKVPLYLADGNYSVIPLMELQSKVLLGPFFIL